MTPKERFERLQRVWRQALEQLDTLHLSGDLDESFYDAWRDCLLSAGATDGEIDCMAASLVTTVVERTEDQAELRREQFELIAHHLASTDMRVTIGKDDSYIAVEFPSRPRWLQSTNARGIAEKRAYLLQRTAIEVFTTNEWLPLIPQGTPTSILYSVPAVT